MIYPNDKICVRHVVQAAMASTLLVNRLAPARPGSLRKLMTALTKSHPSLVSAGVFTLTATFRLLRRILYTRTTLDSSGTLLSDR